MIFTANLTRLIAPAALILLLLHGVVRAGEAADDSAPASLSDIQISFKMDTRLSGGGTYGGERWLSGPTYIGASAQDIVEVRVEGINDEGQRVKINAAWTPSNPRMVEVSPSAGDHVKITVKRAGESMLRVDAQGVSRELLLKAKSVDVGLQVEITQLGAEPAEMVSHGASVLKDPMQKISYAIGMNLAKTLQKQSVEVDAGLLIQGFNDALSGGKTFMTEEEVKATLAVMQTELINLQTEKKKELAEKNKKEGEAFLAENGKKDGVVTLSSGLQYKILKTGEGKKPGAADTVVVMYRGTLLDGTEFTSSYQPAVLSLRGVMKGWVEALQLMPIGSKWQLFIPSNLAYGDLGLGPRSKVGPNSAVIFEIELISIKEPQPVKKSKR